MCQLHGIPMDQSDSWNTRIRLPTHLLLYDADKESAMALIEKLKGFQESFVDLLLIMINIRIAVRVTLHIQ